MSSEHFDQVATSIGEKAQMVGGGTTLVGWLGSSEGGVVLGLVIAALGLVVSFIFQWRRDRREQRVADAEIAKLNKITKPAAL